VQENTEFSAATSSWALLPGRQPVWPNNGALVECVARSGPPTTSAPPPPCGYLFATTPPKLSYVPASDSLLLVTSDADGQAGGPDGVGFGDRDMQVWKYHLSSGTWTARVLSVEAAFSAVGRCRGRFSVSKGDISAVVKGGSLILS